MFWTPRLCRVCASIGEVTYPIFDNLQTEPTNIETMLKKCFSFNIFNDGFKPNEVCSDCLEKLTAFASFIDQFNASSSKFESIIYESDNVESKRLESNPFEKSQSSEVIKTTDNLKGDYAETKTPNIRDITSSPGQGVVRHSREYVDFCISDTGKKRFKCSKCDKSFARKTSLKAHMATHTNIKPYRCEHCDKSFPILSLLTRHKVLHSDSFCCKFCAKSFTAPSKLEVHLRTHTKEKPFKCQVENCGQIFSDKRNLMGHMVTHSDARNFTCDVCKNCYKTSKRLKDHQKCHAEGKYSCDVCPKTYKWNANLIAHKKTHRDIR